MGENLLYTIVISEQNVMYPSFKGGGLREIRYHTTPAHICKHLEKQDVNMETQISYCYFV